MNHEEFIEEKTKASKCRVHTDRVEKKNEYAVKNVLGATPEKAETPRSGEEDTN